MIEITGKLKPKNGNSFKIADLQDIDYDGKGVSAKTALDGSSKGSVVTFVPSDNYRKLEVSTGLVVKLSGTKDDEIINSFIADNTVFPAKYLFLEGTININAPILVSDYTSVVGCNKLTKFNITGNCSLFAIRETSKTVLNHCEFKSFSVYGSNSGVSTSMMLTSSVRHSVFDGLVIANCYHGLHLAGSSGESDDNKIAHCEFTNNRFTGLTVGKNSVVTECVISDNAPYKNGTTVAYGYGVQAIGENVQIINNHFERNRVGLGTLNLEHSILALNTFKNSFEEDIQCLVKAIGNIVSNNVFGGKALQAVGGIDCSKFGCITITNVSDSTSVNNNLFIGNNFSLSPSVEQEQKFAWIIKETENCDYSIIKDNFLTNSIAGYGNPFIIVGLNSCEFSNYSEMFPIDVGLLELSSANINMNMALGTRGIVYFNEEG